MKMLSKVAFALSISTAVGLTAPRAEAFLLVANSKSNNIVRFDEVTGTFLGDFTTPGLGGLQDPDDLTFGPDGNLYVSMGGSNSLSILDPTYPQNSAVLRFSPGGEFLGVAASGNGLSRPYGNAFGPDGLLYVSSFRSNEILRFNGQTGEFIDVFASDNNKGFGSINGLNGPNGLLFGPDGSLYVTTEGTANDANGSLIFGDPNNGFRSQVLRYTPEQVLGLAATTIPQVFIDQPIPLAESFDFVSLLGLALAPNEQSIFVSDFAGGIREYNLAGELLNILSTNYTGTSPSSNFIGSLTFGIGESSNDLFAVGFDNTATGGTIGSILEFTNAQGSPTAFTGTAFTSARLVRPIGVAAAIPEPSTIAGVTIALGGLGSRWLKKRRQGKVKKG